jgi:predicted NBD/HSP70 family sugar kinase
LALPTTRANLIETLGGPGWIAEDSEADPDGGQLWRLGEACGNVLAISAGREELSCGLARPDGQLIGEEHVKLHIEPPSGQRQAGPSDFEKELAALLGDCLQARDRAPIVAVAVAWPGRVDPALNEGRGDPHKHCYTGSWKVEGMSLAERVKSALKLAGLTGSPPVYVVNDADANLMALAHSTLEDRRLFPDTEDHPGLAKIKEMIDGSRVTLGATIAGGVGGALIMAPEQGSRRTVQRGSHGFVGELGQIPVDVTRPGAEQATMNIGEMVTLSELKENKSFPKWKPAYRDTLDHYASARSIVEQRYKKLEGGYTGRIRDIRKRLEQGGDALLGGILERSGRLLGQALIGPILTIDPDLIVISNFAYSDDLLEGVQQALKTSAAHVGLEQRKILLAPADPSRTVKGAARWAIEARIAPVLEEVCGTGNGRMEAIKQELWADAI